MAATSSRNERQPAGGTCKSTRTEALTKHERLQSCRDVSKRGRAFRPSSSCFSECRRYIAVRGAQHDPPRDRGQCAIGPRHIGHAATHRFGNAGGSGGPDAACRGQFRRNK